MKRISHRVHDCADLRRDARQGQHIRRRHHDVFGKRAVAVDADDARVLADMAVARAALEAMPADDVSFGGDELTDPQARDAIPEPLNLTGELVTHHDGRLDATLRPRIPIGDVEIGAADAGMPDGDQHFAGARGRLGHGLHGQSGRALFLHDGLHVLGIRDWD